MKTRCSRLAGAPHVPGTETERGEAEELRFMTALLLGSRAGELVHRASVRHVLFHFRVTWKLVVMFPLLAS